MKILICGATGNIGQQVIKYIKKTNHQIIGISYFHNFKLAETIKSKYFYSPINHSNVNSYEELIVKSRPDIIVNAIIGFAGLKITLLSIKHKIDLALANKESLVVAGQFVMRLAKKNGVNIYPIDSEHASLMQIIKYKGNKFKQLYITASGGLFYNTPKNQMKNISYQQAINHPTWKMGAKISIDSSTLMNKCFEIIECYWYFKTKKINVLYHPQSVVHAIIDYKNHSFACIYKPSMVVPITMLFNKFQTLSNTIKTINLKKTSFVLKKIKPLKPIKWGYEVIKNPHSSLPVILNAANEVFVEQFKNNKIKYIDILKMINQCISQMKIKKITSIKEVYTIDKQVRELCYQMV